MAIARLGWAARALALGVVWLASAAVAAPVAPASPTLRQVVARYIAWRGGPAFRASWRSTHEVVDLQLFGLSGTLEAWQTQDHWRSQIDAPGIRRLTVVTARGSWATNVNGQVQADPDAYRYARRDPQSADALEGKGGAKAALRGAETADGRSWQVVRVTFGDADTYDDFIDPETGELGAMRLVVKGQQGFEHYSDWRWVRGQRVAFATRVVTAAGDTQSQTLRRLEVNGRVDPALFARPTAARHLVFAAGRSSTDWIAFTGAERGRIYLPVTVNGRAAKAMFDSAADVSALDTAFAARLSLKPQGTARVGGENGVDSAGLATGIDISLGDATLKDVTAPTMALRPLVGDEGWSVLLGNEVFYEAVVDIDFPGHRLALRDPASFRPPPGAIVVRLVSDGGSPLAPLSIEGGPTALFLIDTGFWPTLRLSPHLTGAQHLLAGKPFITGSLSAVGGAAEGKVASLRTVSLGGVSFANVPAIFSDAWPSATYSDRVQGLLGVGVLSRFRAIVDWSRGRLYLIPAADAVTAPFARDRFGAAWKRDGEAMVITGVEPGSPAAKAGLAAGQRIDTVNGKPATDVGDVGAWPPGTVVTLVGHVGARIVTTTLTLRDYY